mgnify:CR=1 FL=1|jgi:hypothetical protein|tara:strand:- start:5070 stop:6074 length:1005 start_codon:yes stop_codon:yes gene_type:complete
MFAHTAGFQSLAEHDGPFLTFMVPAPSSTADAAHRFEVEQANAFKEISDIWPPDEIETLGQRLAGLPHDSGAAAVAIHAKGGPTIVEFIENGIENARLDEGPLPRLAPLIEARQRLIAHIVVEADLTGANITAIDRGKVVATDAFDGATVHVHRAHPGGRSEQRAENTWETNADNVAEAVRVLADQVEARLILVSGPTRAQSMVARSIADIITTRVECVDAGDLDGIAAEVLRYTADVAARDSKAIIAKAREAQGTGQAPTSTEQLIEALGLGQVDTLLIHDGADTTFGPEPRLIDRCIKQALLTDSDIRIVPNVDILDNGAAALLRWQPETSN